jgi:hypothetical protein
VLPKGAALKSVIEEAREAKAALEEELARATNAEAV